MPDGAAPLANEAVVRRLGRTEYASTWRAMQSFTAGRAGATADELWITEHLPVYTLGLAGRAQHLLCQNGIPVLKVDRGGQVTYHGPGQLVMYVLVDLRRAALGVRQMVRALEAALIDWLRLQGVDGYRKDSAPGVYVRLDRAEAKIAALGLRVKNGCTYHGLSLNLDMDLAPFRDIDPCGYPGLRVTQVADFTTAPTVAAAGEALAPLLAHHLRSRASE